jgi:squalene-hopene/tetraprenyl-beta-curcumene cyclase
MTAGPAAIDESLANARERLLRERTAGGHWEGELSSSALSTATAVVALAVIDPLRHRSIIDSGLDWLRRNQNVDGGFGDTPGGKSNLSTAVLCWSAFGVAGGADSDASQRVARWIETQAGGLDPDVLTEKIAARYGRDRTFSVPILMTAALGGKLGPFHEAWRRVLPLPFELAALPRRTFATLRLPVVSYALPALIAIGQARFHHAPPPPPVRWWRSACVRRTRSLLRNIQPPSGGFLEATPLTSFVSMALASTGAADEPVIRRGEEFLLRSRRPDGSWPIDTNLATWVTTLSVKALGRPVPGAAEIVEWLLRQQGSERHPYTGAAPGGWAWTDLSGGVPDADDTAGGLRALKILAPNETKSAAAAVKWLLGVQNRDGGVPTFCRGWGALPFDRSSPDITAHALRAWNEWASAMDDACGRRIERARTRALEFLAETQQADGSWIPLWFGNEHRSDEENPTYGTAMVSHALPAHDPMRLRGIDWLRSQQNADGGWGGGDGSPSSIEETALAIEALAREDTPAVQRGVTWLIERTDAGRVFTPSPVGFYFARLWYFERLYPLIWTVGALRAVRVS